MKTKERDCRLDYARATAVLMMLLQHVLIYLHSSNYTVTYVSAALVEFLMMITKSAVPLFIIITGSLLLDSERDFPYQKGIKLAWRMIKIIAIWNVINAIYFYFNDGLKVAAAKLVYGNYWYLYMLVGLYLLMPIINPILRNYNKTKIPYYVIALTFIYELWLSYSTLLPDGVYTHAARFVGKFMLSVVTGYTGFLFLGYMLRKGEWNINFESKKVKVAKIIIGILMLILLAYAIVIAVKNNEYNYVCFDEFTAFTIGAVIFYSFQRLKTFRIIGGGHIISISKSASFYRHPFLRNIYCI